MPGGGTATHSSSTTAAVCGGPPTFAICCGLLIPYVLGWFSVGDGLTHCTSPCQPIHRALTLSPWVVSGPSRTVSILGPGSKSHWVGRERVKGNEVRGRFLFFWFWVVSLLLAGSGYCSREDRHCSRWNDLVGEHAEVATSDHEGGQVHHKGVSLEMEVLQHFIRAPVANKFDDISVNAATEQCHGTASL